jgi:hypothetical protein
MSLAMAAGRKRKPGKREVNGRLLRALADRTSVAGTVKDLAIIARERLDPALASPLGRLLRLGEIRASEYDAGLKYRALRAATDRSLGLPARHPSGLDLNAARGLSAFAAVQDPENDKAIVRAFMAAEDAIGRGSKRLTILQSVVLYDDAPQTYEQKLALKEGLGILVKHWGIGA